MKSPFAPLLLVLTATASAQLRAERPLITEDSSTVVAGIPRDGLWVRQFRDPRDGDYLDALGIHRVRWQAQDSTYLGFLGGADCRVLPLGAERLLLEWDDDFGQETHLALFEWRGGMLFEFELDGEDGSGLVRRLENAGAVVRDRVARGSAEAILQALRTHAFGPADVDCRWRRPTHAEMGIVWGYLEYEQWSEKQERLLAQIEGALDRLDTLGDLHVAQLLTTSITYGHGDALDALQFLQFEYAKWPLRRFEELGRTARRHLETIEEKIEARMAELDERIEVLLHEESTERFPMGVLPGERVRFHVVVTRADNGLCLEDTRRKGEPAEAVVAESMPEGIQYGLRRMAEGEVLRLRIPPDLAFGYDHGEVVVELELIEGLGRGIETPALTSSLTGYRVAPFAESGGVETPSRLRYRDLAPGAGAHPAPGESVVVRMATWTAAGRELAPLATVTLQLDDDSLPAGLREGLATMRPGGQRLLYLPRQLAYEDPARAGGAVRIAVELLRIEGSPAAPR